MPAVFPRLYPPPVQKRRDAGHAAVCDAQSLFLQSAKTLKLYNNKNYKT